MSSKTTVGQCAVDMLARFPSAPTQTLAKAMRKKWPDVFTSIGQARDALRYYRGARGKALRSHCTDKKHFRTNNAESAECRKWSTLVPDAEPNSWAWQSIPEEPQRWLILADMHVPYHDKRAVTTALEHADGNCDAVLILGDLVDSYQLSSFDRDPRKRKYSEELLVAWDILQAMLELKPKAIVFKGGNHERRVERYLCRRAPELFDMDVFSFPKFLRDGPTWLSDGRPAPSAQKFAHLLGGGIQWVRPVDPIRHHQLAILHGDEWGQRFSSPVNPARGAFLKAHECVIQGHEHRCSVHEEATVFGTVVRCWSVACLADLHPEYRPLGNKWAHGFAYLNAGSDWSIENHTIIEGKVF